MENICFVDHNYLSYNQLNEDTVVDYFSTSPFYDPSCNNEILKMQTQFRGLSLNQEVDNIKGVYYVLEKKNDENTLFVIKKAVNKGNEHENLSFYYVMHGYIYEAPTNYSISISRTTDMFWYLNNILDQHIEKLDFDSINPCNINEGDLYSDDEMDVFKDIVDKFQKLSNKNR